MTDDLEPGDQTKDRIAARSAIAFSILATACLTAFARDRLSGSDTSSSLDLLGYSFLAAAAICLLCNRYYRSADRRIAEAETAALFAGRANIYIDQIRVATETSGAARRARAGWIRLLTQGQGVMEGTLRLDGDGIHWAPARLARWFRMEEWTVDLDQVGYVSVTRTALRVGKGGIATLQLRSGFPIDLLLRRASLWPWLFFPGLAFLAASWVGDSDHPWGLLPFAEGQVRGVTATYERGIGVILRGVHPDFVRATKLAQGRVA
ncbi:MAG: hypothetical protein R2761_09385 [Acidimicrobiales bacterium]